MNGDSRIDQYFLSTYSFLILQLLRKPYRETSTQDSDRISPAGKLWPIHHRSHPLSVQWHSIWDPAHQHFENDAVQIPSISVFLCRSSQHETYFYLRQSSIHRIFVKILLLEREAGVIVGESY